MYRLLRKKINHCNATLKKKFRLRYIAYNIQFFLFSFCVVVNNVDEEEKIKSYLIALIFLSEIPKNSKPERKKNLKAYNILFCMLYSLAEASKRAGSIFLIFSLLFYIILLSLFACCIETDDIHVYICVCT
jgi:hypothetical protein